MGGDTNPEMGTRRGPVADVLRRIGHLCVVCCLFFGGIVVILPFLIDILLNAICPGEAQCPRVIFLTGALQVVVGLGTVFMGPVLGSISDGYGRRPVLIIVFCSAVVPAVLLAYSRSTMIVYIWYVTFAAASILRESGCVPVSLAYVADVVDESKRALAVGLWTSSVSSSFLIGTAAALALKYDYQAFWFSAGMQILAAIYVTTFLKETNPRHLLPSANSKSESTTRLLAKPQLKRQRTSLRDSARTISNSPQLRTIALVDFMNSFGAAGLQSFALYYLKSVFDYGKNEFALIVICAGLAAAVGQMLVYPFLAHRLGERGALWIVLVGSSLHYFFYGFAWAYWVPFLASSMSAFNACIQPALGTMVSKAVDPDEQGRVQGFMGGVRSSASISAPLILTTLTAASLGEHPPLNLPGLPFIVCGASLVVALLFSLRLSSTPVDTSSPTDFIHAPLPPEDFIHITAPSEDLLHIPLHPEAASGTEEDTRS